ncbi:MAG: oligosaccharide flippase family protein [Atopobiaceae bacterium]|nr:oligosaccharide flippase family protein [Atopobiaceae bacterium]
MAGIRKNFIYSSAYQILLVLTPIVTTPYLSRVIGAEGDGIFTYTQSIVNYFVLFAMLGMANYGVRSVAECGDDRAARSDLFWNAFAMNCLVGTIVLVAYAGYVVLWGQEQLLLWVLWSMWIIGSVGDVSWLMFGMQEFRVPTIRNFITRLASVVFIFVFVRDATDIWAYVTAIAGAFLMNTALIWPFVGRYVDWVRPTWPKVISHLKPNLALFVPVIASSLYVLLDKVMLGAMAGMDQTGMYDYAEKIAKMPLAVITALGSVVLPKMSEVIAAGRVEEGKQLVRSTMWFMLACAFALTCGIAGIAPEFVPVFFGPGFEPCVALMRVLSLVIPLICATNVIGVQYLLPHHRDRDFTLSVSAGAVINLGINVFAITAMGAMGAAIATIAAEVAVLVYQAVVVRKEFELRANLFGAIPFACIGVAMIAIMRMVAQLLGSTAPTVVGVLVEFVVAALFYLVASLGWCMVTRNEDFARVFGRLAYWKE